MKTSNALALVDQFARRRAFPFAQASAARLRETMDELAVRMLGRDFEERLGRVHLELADGQVDPFGFDLQTAKYAVAAAAFFHRLYFRTEVHGIERVPRSRVLLIANHSGQLPIDAMLIGAAMFLDAEPPRVIRSMVEKWTQTLPFVGTFFQRVGQVVGVPENARRLLAQGEALMVFPEGAQAISKPIWRRYQLSRFGLGFMRLAIETNTPIVPIGVVGGEEQYINVGNLDRVARMLQIPTFPVVPQWFIPGAQLPLPTKYRLYFGEPRRFDGDADDEDAVIEKKVDVVRRDIEALLRGGLEKRKSIFW